MLNKHVWQLTNHLCLNYHQQIPTQVNPVVDLWNHNQQLLYPIGVEFSNLDHCYLYCRQIDVAPDAFPFSNGEYVTGHPPFSVEDEVALFKRLKIDWLVLRNAGGERSMSKLIAARNLGMPVAMIDRPSPVAPSVETVDQALEWLKIC